MKMGDQEDLTRLVQIQITHEEDFLQAAEVAFDNKALRDFVERVNPFPSGIVLMLPNHEAEADVLRQHKAMLEQLHGILSDLEKGSA